MRYSSTTKSGTNNKHKIFCLFHHENIYDIEDCHAIKKRYKD
jgi:hypothetical protein